MTDRQIIGQRAEGDLPRYAGIATFARSRDWRTSSMPISPPWASCSISGRARPKARFGPSYIREHSRQLHPYHAIHDAFPLPPPASRRRRRLRCRPYADIDAAVDDLHQGPAADLVQGTRLIAPAATTPSPSHCLALQRSRARPSGCRPLRCAPGHRGCCTASVWHGLPFRRAAEEGLLDLDHCQHVGIRGGIYDPSELADDTRAGFQIIRTGEFQERTMRDIAEQIRRRVGSGPVYISIDIDVLDPAQAPATGTPEVEAASARGSSSRSCAG